jgi:cytoskeletal protein CcmA (bactofilin family)
MKYLILLVALWSSLATAVDEVITEDTQLRSRIIEFGDSLTLDGPIYVGNLVVDGGVLIVKNSAIIEGKITVLDDSEFICENNASLMESVQIIGGSFVSESQCYLQSKLNVIDAQFIQITDTTINGSVIIQGLIEDFDILRTSIGKNLHITEANVVFIEDTSIGGNIKVENTNEFHFHDQSVGGNIKIQGANIFVMNDAYIEGNIMATENEIAALVSVDMADNTTVKMNNNEQAVLSDFSSRGTLILKDNVITTLVNSSSGILKLRPGNGACTFSNVTSDRLIGGCN